MELAGKNNPFLTLGHLAMRSCTARTRMCSCRESWANCPGVAVRAAEAADDSRL